MKDTKDHPEEELLDYLLHVWRLRKRAEEQAALKKSLPAWLRKILE